MKRVRVVPDFLMILFLVFLPPLGLLLLCITGGRTLFSRFFLFVLGCIWFYQTLTLFGVSYLSDLLSSKHLALSGIHAVALVDVSLKGADGIRAIELQDVDSTVYLPLESIQVTWTTVAGGFMQAIFHTNLMPSTIVAVTCDFPLNFETVYLVVRDGGIVRYTTSVIDGSVHLLLSVPFNSVRQPEAVREVYGDSGERLLRYTLRSSAVLSNVLFECSNIERSIE